MGAWGAGAGGLVVGGLGGFGGGWVSHTVDFCGCCGVHTAILPFFCRGAVPCLSSLLPPCSSFPAPPSLCLFWPASSISTKSLETSKWVLAISFAPSLFSRDGGRTVEREEERICRGSFSTG